ncbi:MAG: D-alanine--D-alanine ligase [Verrucomicrobiota bacterium]
MQLTGHKIALLKGGPGSERAVSLETAKGVSLALDELGAGVIDVDVTGPDFVMPSGVLAAFNVIHGTYGEDGGLQRELEARGVPYTGAGSVSSALAFDKERSKAAFVAAGVPTTEYQVLELAGATAADVEIPLPLVMKPLREGSSVGVHIIKEESGIAAAIEDLAKFGTSALVEPFISGKELTVGILGEQVLPIVHIQPRTGFYDISNKYPWMTGQGGSDYFCPADLSPETTERVKAAALAAHQSLGVEVYSRVDVLLDADDNPYVLEVNTIPGMTSTSLLPKAALAAGITYPALCARILELSLAVKR